MYAHLSSGVRQATEAFKDKLEQLLGPLYNRRETIETYLDARAAEEEDNEEGDKAEAIEGEESDGSRSANGSQTPSDEEDENWNGKKKAAPERKKWKKLAPLNLNLAGTADLRRYYVEQMLNYAQQENARLDEDDEDDELEARRKRHSDISTSGSLTARPTRSLSYKRTAALVQVPSTERRHYSSSSTLSSAVGDLHDGTKEWSRAEKHHNRDGDGSDAEAPPMEMGSTDGEQGESNEDEEAPGRRSGRTATSTGGRVSPGTERRTTVLPSKHSNERKGVSSGNSRNKKLKKRSTRKAGSEILLTSKEKQSLLKDKNERPEVRGGGPSLRTSKARASTATMVIPSHRKISWADDDHEGGDGDKARSRQQQRTQMYDALVGGENKRRHQAYAESGARRVPSKERMGNRGTAGS